MARRKFNLCYIIGSFPPIKDGVGFWSKHIFGLIRNIKYIKTFLVMPEQSEIDYPKNRILFSKIRLRSLYKIINFIKQNDIDIIHIEYPCKNYGRNIAINILPYLIKLFVPNIKILLTIHEYSSYTLAGRMRITIMVLIADSVFVTDKCNFMELSRIGSNIKNVLCVPPQIPIEIKNDYKRRHEHLIFGYWGYIRKNKGLEILLDSFHKFIRSIAKAKLIIYSELDINNKYHNKIRKMIDSLELEKFVKFKGHLPGNSLASSMIEMDCCILPFTDGVSDRRGTFVASMAMGLPVITTVSDANYIPDELEHNKNVLLTKANSSDIFEVMKSMNEYSLRKKLGIGAARWAEDITWEKIKITLTQEYNKIINNDKEVRN